jgi:hypothetical protein
VDEAPIETRDETLFDNPQFQHYEETSNIQLFFDLFFVANLTTFTNRHEINSVESRLLYSLLPLIDIDLKQNYRHILDSSVFYGLHGAR